MKNYQEKIVLYVDDEPQATKYFDALFGDRFRVSVAQSADEAMRFVQEHEAEVAVVVTDQRMPETTGTELMEQLRIRFPNIVRVLTTAFSNLDAAIQAVNEGGAFRYLTKPWDEGEMIGTLMRASEFHDLMQQRDRLISEKLSVLHRLVVMDRVRGLATAITAMNQSLRNPWQALASYIQQSPVREQIQMQMNDIGELNMLAIARRESEQMLKTVRMILDQTLAVSTGEIEVDVSKVANEVMDVRQATLAEDDIKLIADISDSVQLKCDEGMLKQLIEIMIRRLADIQDQPTTIHLSIQEGESLIRISASGDFGPLSTEQQAAFFAAAIPLKKWPIGLDMDTLSAFLIASHFGGTLTISANEAEFRVELPLNAQHSSVEDDAGLLDQIYESLKDWERDLMPV